MFTIKKNLFSQLDQNFNLVTKASLNEYLPAVYELSNSVYDLQELIVITINHCLTEKKPLDLSPVYEYLKSSIFSKVKSFRKRLNHVLIQVYDQSLELEIEDVSDQIILLDYWSWFSIEFIGTLNQDLFTDIYMPSRYHYSYKTKKLGEKGNLVNKYNFSLKYNQRKKINLSERLDLIDSSNKLESFENVQYSKIFIQLFEQLYLNITSYLLELNYNLFHDLPFDSLLTFFSKLNPDLSYQKLQVEFKPVQNDRWAFKSFKTFRPNFIYLFSNGKTLLYYDSFVDSSDFTNFLVQKGFDLVNFCKERNESSFLRAGNLINKKYRYTHPTVFIRDVIYWYPGYNSAKSLYSSLNLSPLPIDSDRFYKNLTAEYNYWTLVLKNNPKTFYYTTRR